MFDMCWFILRDKRKKNCKKRKLRGRTENEERKIAVKIINMMIVEKIRQAENNEGVLQEKKWEK